MLIGLAPAWAASEDFHVEEATIEGLHSAIRQGKTTCQRVVQAYLDRARAYNGICTRLVTKDGGPIPAAKGTVRAGAPLKFPTETVAISTILPKFDEYKGLPIDYGRMEPTQSDPSVEQQYGMVTGMPKAGQLNALSTLNVRGERSLSCKAECDLHPSKGPLPKSCPEACDAFRKQPDALERAAELDRQFGRRPDLEKMPMYCVALLVQGCLRYAGYAHDRRRRRELRDRCAAPGRDRRGTAAREGRASSTRRPNLAEYNGGAGNPGGTRGTKRVFGAGSRSSWAGTACKSLRYGARNRGGSSSGSAASVGAQPGPVLALRGDGRLVPPAGVAQRRRRIRGDEGHDRRTAERLARTCTTIAPGIQCRTVNDAARAARCASAIRKPA